jgi:hypothetical protein
MMENAAVYDEARAAYESARHEVFDLPGWTPTAVLTLDQTLCVVRLERAETAVDAVRATRPAAKLDGEPSAPQQAVESRWVPTSNIT